MISLVIDTCNSNLLVALVKNDEILSIYNERVYSDMSTKIFPAMQEVFNSAGILPNDIDNILVANGPGSFTGIRIGIATVKAFNDSLNIPCIGISSLEALAYNINNNSSLVCSILDSKNDNCYFALYERKEKLFETLIEPQAEDIYSALSILKSYIDDNFENSNITFVGDGSKIYETQIKETFNDSLIADENQDNLNSYNLGICGYQKFVNSGCINEDILPLYLKKPQAQKLLEEKMKGTSNNE